MSYTVGYYIAAFIAALGLLCRVSVVVCIITGLVLFIRGYNLLQEQKPKDEPLGALVDWTNGGKLQKWGLLILFVLSTIMFMLGNILPDQRVAIIHMGWHEPPCMSGEETGILLAGSSDANTRVGWYTFKMSDGVSIMCRIDNMNAAATQAGARYRVNTGERVS